MRYFTIAELIKSETADKKAIDNRLPKELLPNAQALVDNVLDPLREAYGKPITVTSGYRCPALNKAVGGSKTSDHCFDEETELLTTDGWKKYYELSEGETIFSYSMDRNRVEVVPIAELIMYRHTGKMMRVHNQIADICVTDGHRMFIRYDSHKYIKKNTKSITQNGQAYFDSLKTNNDKYHIELAKDIFGKRRWFMCASNSPGVIDMADSMDMLRLVMAIVSDGFLHIRNRRFHGIGFNLKKERKITRVAELLNKINIPIKTKLRKDGALTFWINSTDAKPIFEMVGEDKILPRWLWLLPGWQQKELLYEYAFFDGHRDEREGNANFSITTVSDKNRDTIHGMCVLSGMRSVCSVKSQSKYVIKGKCGTSKEAYMFSICDNRSETRLKETDYQWVDYDGIVWCANNVNTTVIVRRNGKVSIQGNCNGCAADIVGTPNTPKENKRLFNLIQELKLPFDQVIDEKNFSWVHVSHRREGNRNQVLKL